MYEVQLQNAFLEVSRRNKIRKEGSLPALNLRSQTYGVFYTKVVTRWDRMCDNHAGLHLHIRQLVANELDRHIGDQRVHRAAAVLFGREVARRTQVPIPTDNHLREIFNRWWEEYHAV